jgi:hypothetical protein
VPVRTATGGPLPLSGGVALVYDPEMPLGQPVTYSSTESPAVVSAAVTVDSLRAWLVHPGLPELSQPIFVSELSARKQAVQRGVFQPLGRRSPVVQTDGARKTPEYQLDVLTRTVDERAALDALLWDAGVLLLNVPAGKGWGVTSEYVSVGDVTESRVERYLGHAERVWSLPCTVVDRPLGGSQAERTWADVIVDNATWADVLGKYPTWLDLLAGP